MSGERKQESGDPKQESGDPLSLKMTHLGKSTISMNWKSVMSTSLLGLGSSLPICVDKNG